ncbi:MAG: SAM-dependent methyltransferase [Desulfuromonas sp.]|nr:MAG: SAM-dependent methyltransferase [Desulfuromonas sp.]
MGLINWSIAKLYDPFMRSVEKNCLGAWRQELLSGLDGNVLEVGAGTGVNLDHYPAGISELVLTEPDRHMRARLSPKLVNLPIPHRVIDTAAEQLPFADASFDAAVVTLVLCSVNHPEKSLDELYRILKPGGKLVLLEHVVDPDSLTVKRWQHRIEPLWKCCAGNCHLTRDTLSALQVAGFDTENIRRDRMRGAPALFAPLILGIAEKG